MEEQDTLWQAQELEVQELTAACMKEQGFNYIPWDQSPMTQNPNAEADRLRGTREFAEKYGFGIHLTAVSAEPTPVQDPNSAHVQAMPPLERQAWTEALNGAPAETESNGPDPAPGMGCEGRARVAVIGDSAAIAADPQVEAMWAEFDHRLDEIRSEPDMVEAVAAWASCLEERGFPGHDEPDTVSADLSTKWAELNGRLAPDNQPAGPAPTSTGPPVVDLEAFRREEIALAVADFECGSDLRALRETLEIEMEQTFVQENLEVLTRIRDSGTHGRGGGG